MVLGLGLPALGGVPGAGQQHALGEGHGAVPLAPLVQVVLAGFDGVLHPFGHRARRGGDPTTGHQILQQFVVASIVPIAFPLLASCQNQGADLAIFYRSVLITLEYHLDRRQVGPGALLGLAHQLEHLVGPLTVAVLLGLGEPLVVGGDLAQPATHGSICLIVLDRVHLAGDQRSQLLQHVVGPVRPLAVLQVGQGLTEAPRQLHLGDLALQLVRLQLGVVEHRREAVERRVERRSHLVDHLFGLGLEPLVLTDQVGHQAPASGVGEVPLAHSAPDHAALGGLVVLHDDPFVGPVVVVVLGPDDVVGNGPSEPDQLGVGLA